MSPLERAWHTAALISGREAQRVPSLIEMDWGEWEGQKGVELLDRPDTDYRHIEDWGWDYRPPGGESPGDLRDRLVPWAQNLTENTVAVCHIGIMRVLLAIATGWNFDGEAPFRVKRNRLFIIDLSPDGWRIDGEPVRLVPAA